MQVVSLRNKGLKMDALELEYQKYYVIRGMEYYGGSFIKGLAKALLHADFKNTWKIYRVWNDEWTKYYEWGRQLEKGGES